MIPPAPQASRRFPLQLARSRAPSSRTSLSIVGKSERGSFRSRAAGVWSHSLFQAPDVRHQPLNLVGLQTLAVRRHLVLALVNHVFQLRVALAPDFRIRKAQPTHALACRRIAPARTAMAARALCRG